MASDPVDYLRGLAAHAAADGAHAVAERYGAAADDAERLQAENARLLAILHRMLVQPEPGYCWHPEHRLARWELLWTSGEHAGFVQDTEPMDPADVALVRQAVGDV